MPVFTSRVQDGLLYFVFEPLEAYEVRHVIASRRGGVSPSPYASLNMSTSVGDEAANVRANRERAARLLGVSAQDLVIAALSHGTNVRVVGRADKGKRIPATDALVTAEPAVPLFMTFADCVPILVYDPVRHALGLVHAGWRGTAAGVLKETIHTLRGLFGTRPEDLCIAFGPAIGPCHYEVGPEVVETFRRCGNVPVIARPSQDGRVYLDLIGSNERQAAALGVRRFFHAGICTACHTELFFSHRGEGGRTGRFGVIAMLAP